MSILRDVRTVLYAGFHSSAVLRELARKTGNHPHFGASPCPLLADVSQRGLVLHDDAYAPSSNILSIATCLAGLSCLAQSLPPFPPASDPELAEGLMTSRTPGEGAVTPALRG